MVARHQFFGSGFDQNFVFNLAALGEGKVDATRFDIAGYKEASVHTALSRVVLQVAHQGGQAGQGFGVAMEVIDVIVVEAQHICIGIDLGFYLAVNVFISCRAGTKKAQSAAHYTTKGGIRGNLPARFQ
ncbi:MAG: hypothetical protein BWY75_03098 [bacterium ADurb.Bin425]|nr:MAG: hypothetical protein BWY75_03098 [bacterium ADurb.Bin425]